MKIRGKKSQQHDLKGWIPSQQLASKKTIDKSAKKCSCQSFMFQFVMLKCEPGYN